MDSDRQQALRCAPAEVAAAASATRPTTTRTRHDTLGECVIAGRAHQTLRFEDIEPGSVPMIKDADVRTEYFKETGGPDSGLVVLDSLKAWQTRGWKVGTRTYKIRAYAAIDFKNHQRSQQVKQAIFSDVGIGLGVHLPKAAEGQVRTGQPSSLTTGLDAKPVSRRPSSTSPSSTPP